MYIIHATLCLANDLDQRIRLYGSVEKDVRKI